MDINFFFNFIFLSLTSNCQLTPRTVRAWKQLPELIKNDSTFRNLKLRIENNPDLMYQRLVYDIQYTSI